MELLDSRAVRNLLIDERTRVRFPLFILRRRSLWRIRFSADLWLGIQNLQKFKATWAFDWIRRRQTQVTEYRDGKKQCQAQPNAGTALRAVPKRGAPMQSGEKSVPAAVARACENLIR